MVTIDEYIDSASSEVRNVLHKIREIIRANVPEAEECINYQMPAFRQGRVFIYFAAFNKHIGIYPPLTHPESLIAELSPYRNEKGNLGFPLKEPIPYELIARVAKALHEQYSQ